MKIFQNLQNYHANLVETFISKLKFSPVKFFKILEKTGHDPVTLVLTTPNNPAALIMITNPIGTELRPYIPTAGFKYLHL
jgi:ribosome biogenesis protein Nip4